MIASLLETCKFKLGRSPGLADRRAHQLVNQWPASRIDELMPWAYAAKPA